MGLMFRPKWGGSSGGLPFFSLAPCKLRPKTRPRGHQDSPRGHQDGPSGSQEAPKRHPRRPKRPPKTPPSSPGSHQEASKTAQQAPKRRLISPRGLDECSKTVHDVKIYVDVYGRVLAIKISIHRWQTSTAVLGSGGLVGTREAFRITGGAWGRRDVAVGVGEKHRGV